MHRWRCCLQQQQRGFAIFFLFSWEQILLEFTFFLFGDCFFGLLLPVLLGSRWTMMSSVAVAAPPPPPLPPPPNFLWLLYVFKVSETSSSVVVVFLYGVVRKSSFRLNLSNLEIQSLSVCLCALRSYRERQRRSDGSRPGAFEAGKCETCLLLEFSLLFFSVFRVSAYYDFVFLNECCYWCLLSVVDSSLAVVCAFWRWFASVVFLFYFVLFRFSGDRSSQGKEIKKQWRGCRGGGLLIRGGSSSFEQVYSRCLFSAKLSQTSSSVW